MIHIIKKVERVGSKTEVTVNCGEVIKARSLADAYGEATGWWSLSTCPACRALGEGRSVA